jgi:beta-glucosidase
VTSQVTTTGTATATFKVTNTGTVAGTDIVPVYVSQAVSSVVVPPQRLVGWARVNVAAGKSKMVTVTFPASALGVSVGDINSAAPPTVQPGQYQVVLDKNDTTPYDVAQTATFSVS